MYWLMRIDLLVEFLLQGILGKENIFQIKKGGQSDNQDTRSASHDHFLDICGVDMDRTVYTITLVISNCCSYAVNNRRVYSQSINGNNDTRFFSFSFLDLGNTPKRMESRSLMIGSLFKKSKNLTAFKQLCIFMRE